MQQYARGAKEVKKLIRDVRGMVHQASMDDVNIYTTEESNYSDGGLVTTNNATYFNAADVMRGK